jgi:hypothetical protein
MVEIAPLLRASKPKAPVPAYRSSTAVPATAFLESNELNMLSRMRSEVGRVLFAGETSFLEPTRPPIILVMSGKA